MKLENIHTFAKNQYAIITNNYCSFWSYNSHIAQYNYKTQKITLGEDWNYSKTTLKYLYFFIENFTSLNYKSKKEIEKAIKNKEIKINKNFKSI